MILQKNGLVKQNFIDRQTHIHQTDILVVPPITALILEPLQSILQMILSRNKDENQ